MKTIDEKEAERHRAKMAKRKAVQDAEVAGKSIEKGLLIGNTGPGKGRNAKPALIEAADLVTEMSATKHHFAAGVKAQQGIEF